MSYYFLLLWFLETNTPGRFFHLNDCFRGDKCHMVHAPKEEVSENKIKKKKKLTFVLVFYEFQIDQSSVPSSTSSNINRNVNVKRKLNVSSLI